MTWLKTLFGRRDTSKIKPEVLATKHNSTSRREISNDVDENLREGQEARLIKESWDLYASGGDAEAIKMLNSCLREKNSILINLALARIYNDLGKGRKTIEYGNKALNLDAANSLAHTFIGSGYIEINRPIEAVSHFFKALEIGLDNEYGNKYLGKEYSREYTYELLGRLVLEAWIQEGSMGLATISVFGGPHVDIQRLQAGIELYERGCEENWQWLYSYYRMGILYYNSENPENIMQEIGLSANSGYEPAHHWMDELNRA